MGFVKKFRQGGYLTIEDDIVLGVAIVFFDKFEDIFTKISIVLQDLVECAADLL